MVRVGNRTSDGWRVQVQGKERSWIDAGIDAAKRRQPLFLFSTDYKHRNVWKSALTLSSQRLHGVTFVIPTYMIFQDAL